jgi:hypothetical protein
MASIVFARTRRAEEDRILFGGDEVQGSQVGDGLPLEGTLVVVVELLQRLAGRKPRGPDAPLPAVRVAGADLPLQAGGEELLVCPALGPGPVREPLDAVAQGGGLQRPGQVGDLRQRLIPRRPAHGRRRGGGSGRHHATFRPSSRPKISS